MFCHRTSLVMKHPLLGQKESCRWAMAIVLGKHEAMLPTKKIRCERKKCGKCHMKTLIGQASINEDRKATAFTIPGGRIANRVGEQSAILVNVSDKISPQIIMVLG